MTHPLRISGIDYQPPRFVHRRMSSNAWAIVLPGYEKLFKDKDYLATQAALEAAGEDVAQALQLDVPSLLPHCTIEVEITKYRDTLTVRAVIMSASFMNRVCMVACPVDMALAEQLYNANASVLLGSDQAKRILGKQGMVQFTHQWVKTIRNHIYVNNVTQVNLAAPVVQAQPAMRPLKTAKQGQREMWWHGY